MVAGSCFPFSEVFPGFFFFLQDPDVRVTNRCFMCCSQQFPKGAATIGCLKRPLLVVCWCRNGQAGGASSRCYGEWGQTRRNIGQVSVFLTLREVGQARGGRLHRARGYKPQQ